MVVKPSPRKPRLCRRDVWLALALGIISLASSSQAQSKRNVVSVDFINLAFNVLSLEYERVINARSGVGIGWAASVFGAGEISDTRFKVKVFRGTYISYLGSDPPEGGWLGVGAAVGSVDYWEVDRVSDVDHASGIAIGGGIGYRFLAHGVTIGPVLWYQVPFGPRTLSRRRNVVQPFVGGLMLSLTVGLAWSW